MAQKAITNFFKPLQDNKRKLVEDVTRNGNKKLSTDQSATLTPAKVPATNTTNIQKQIDAQAQKSLALSANIGHSWFRALQGEFSKPYFINLSKFIDQERKSATIYPPRDEVFSWTTYCDIQQVKVIILGQDPYHGPKQAHGLAFSVKKGVPPPPSLVNMFTEIRNEYPEFKTPSHGELISWAKQGVLLLNACLTVRGGQANSHSNKGWEQLTDAVIKYINTNMKNRVFLLWGAYAQKKGSFIDKNKHLVLKAVHPSPLSAYRGFFNCGHFKVANEYLTKHNNRPIDWTKFD